MKGTSLKATTLALMAFTFTAISAASAAGPALRWLPPGQVAPASGEATDKGTVLDLRVSRTFPSAEAERYYAVRGIEMLGTDGCALRLLPSFIHPSANRSIQSYPAGCTNAGSPKTVSLPNDYHVTGIQVCTNGQDEFAAKLKGIRLWGAKLDSLGRPIQPMGPVEEKRTGCKEWQNRANCPSGQIAVGVRFYKSFGSIALKCAPARPASDPLNPLSFTIKPAVFDAGNGRVRLQYDIKNEGDTTMGVRGLSVRIGTSSCSVNMDPSLAIPRGYTQSRFVDVPCTWDKIKAGTGCRIGTSCNAKITGTLRTVVAGTEENAPISQTITIRKP